MRKLCTAIFLTTMLFGVVVHAQSPAPSNLTASKIKGSIKAVLLTWTDNSTGVSDQEQGFEIWKSENGGPFLFKGRVPTDYVVFQDNQIDRRNTYKYMVRSMTNCDQTWTFCDFSDFSNVASPW